MGEGFWDTLKSDDNAFDKKINLAGEDIEPQVSWGTNPAQISSIKGKVPHLRDDRNSVKQVPSIFEGRQGRGGRTHLNSVRRRL